MASEVKDDDVAISGAGEPKAVKVIRKVADCPVETVTVFADRAEVTRRVEVTADAAGAHDISLEGFTRFINTESIRVKGSGHFTLLEVSYANRERVKEAPAASAPATEDDEASKNPELLQEELRRLSVREKEIGQERASLRRSLELMDGYASNVLRPPPLRPVSSGDAVEGRWDAPDLDFVEKLLDLQARRVADANKRSNELDAEAAEVNLKRTATQARLTALNAGSDRVTVQSHDVDVSINVAEAGYLELLVTYQVTNASWSPSYDVRISSKDSGMELSYYGLVQQTTGEAWENAKLVLSTAKPAVGGSAPVLPTRTVSFNAPVVYRESYAPRTARTRAHMSRAGPRSFAAPVNHQAAMFNEFAGQEDDSEEEEAAAPVAAVATSKVEGGAASATFTIERPASVHSDNKPHKVTVAILTLESRFRHYTVPTLNPVCYLQALTKNTSDYPLLPSEKVNVYLDGSFVSTTNIASVSPGESFRSFLGVDASIRVTYRPVAIHRTTKGMLTKTESVTYTHKTIIKNSKPVPVNVVIADCLPRSTDERIKVRAVVPSQDDLDAGARDEAREGADDVAAGAGSGTGGDTDAGGDASSGNRVAQNKTTNNVVWTRVVAAGATATVDFEYAIEHAPGQTVHVHG